MASDPLDPGKLLRCMADALPTHDVKDTTSDLSSSHEAFALFAHACMTSLGFRLLGFDQDKLNESECHTLAPRLPPNWNASFNTYSFVYTHQESRHHFVIKIDRMGGKAEIAGRSVSTEDTNNRGDTKRAQITIKEYIANTALPVRITLTDGEEDRSDLGPKIHDVFISETKINDLANLIRTNVIHELLPFIEAGGEHEKSSESASTAQQQDRQNQLSPDDVASLEDAQEYARRPPRPAQELRNPTPNSPHPYLFNDPAQPQPRQPIPAADFPPPGFEDPYDLNRARGLDTSWHGPLRNIGSDDLNPPGLGPHDPLRGGVGAPGGQPFGPGGMSGMHPTYQDFFPEGEQGMRGEFDPQVPPGARYDPIGPGGMPRLGGRRPRGGGDPFSGLPDEGGFGFGGPGRGDFQGRFTGPGGPGGFGGGGFM